MFSATSSGARGDRAVLHDLLAAVQDAALSLGDGTCVARVIQVPVRDEQVIQGADAEARDFESFGEHAHPEPRVHHDIHVPGANDEGVAFRSATERLEMHDPRGLCHGRAPGSGVRA